ncbi:MAG TPA: hypothetical protein QGG59_07350 [Planctomycetota bacterium]|jgi:hypothetical protein|nr:hypothetical protein [Planctomycetota bacterium]MDP6128952.1 hypothetical protein [Planctomycetota bacterium]MDP7246537.1 hypothetical protein [Planctomycetota bacterium]HJM39914.1 hypothetical protein [Planctomycetota bacterium]|tara:strand:- start:19785 stop:20822 length:1038 start_codon:yes stop_codon:yes gene_type:complete
MNKTLIPALLLLATPAFSQSYETICFESFDYPAGPLGGMSGGIGFQADWWSGNNLDDGMAVAPGFDPVGGMMTTNLDHGGSYRLIDLNGLDAIMDQGAIGADGTEVWIRFDSQRSSDDEYGGLTLNWQWNMEGLFIGSPYDQYEWGLDQPWTGNLPYYVPATHCDNLARLVVKVEFNPGDEIAKLWVDPPIDYPTTPPDLEVWFGDFRFNELQLKSGHGLDPLDVGFDFDAIEITAPPWRPIYSTSNIVAGQLGNFDVSNCTPGNNVIIGYSLTGSGPTQTMFGDVDMSPPIGQFPAQVVDQNGDVHHQVTIPPGAAGLTVYSQCVELTGAGTGNLANSLVVTVQ